MDNQRNVLLTGGTGFLGGNLLRRLVGEGFGVAVLKRRTSDLARVRDLAGAVSFFDVEDTDLKGLFGGRRFDAIIHCATSYGRRDEEVTDLLETNLLFPLRLLQLGIKAGVSCFINTDTVLDKRVSHYSLSKGQMKEWLKVLSKDITCMNVALEHFYGPDDDGTKFVTFVVRSILDEVDGIDLTPGGQKRDFIYIDDVVDAFMHIIRHGATLKGGFISYEIGTTHTVEIRKFVELVKELAGNTRTRLNFGALPYRANEVMDSRVDISAVRALGWSPMVSLEEGLMRTIAAEKGLRGK